MDLLHATTAAGQTRPPSLCRRLPIEESKMVTQSLCLWTQTHSFTPSGRQQTVEHDTPTEVCVCVCVCVCSLNMETLTRFDWQLIIMCWQQTFITTRKTEKGCLVTSQKLFVFLRLQKVKVSSKTLFHFIKPFITSRGASQMMRLSHSKPKINMISHMSNKMFGISLLSCWSQL